MNPATDQRDVAVTAVRTDPPLDDLVRRALALVTPGQRVLLGVTGSPGAGKTTVATALVDRINAASDGDHGDAPVAAMVPMDGFHLANATLRRLGRADRKGALDTFDGWGFVALLQRLHREVDHDVLLPSFRRTVDEPIAAELVVPAGTSLVVVEGNYLLATATPWDQVRGLLAECWFATVSDAERIARLEDRHTRHGRTPEAAHDWAIRVDGANAALVEQTRHRADLVITTAQA